MRRLLWLLLAAAGGVLVASQVARQPGYVLLAWGDWRVEIRSLLVALLLVGGVFLALHWLLGSATRARQALWRRAAQRRLRRREQGERDLAAGVLAVLEAITRRPKNCCNAAGARPPRRCCRHWRWPILPSSVGILRAGSANSPPPVRQCRRPGWPLPGCRHRRSSTPAISRRRR